MFRRSSHTAVIEALKSGSSEAKAVESIQRHVAENWELIRKHLVDYIESESGKAAKPARAVPAAKRTSR